MTAELLARAQFAFTAAIHYLYPPLSIGLGLALVMMEGLWLKTGNPKFHSMARFWTRIFALTFAIGVATGIVMEFEFGTNWATYSRFVGDIFGSALAAEGIFAFFLESGFLALLLFGWNKVGPRMHFFATCMVAFGAHFSAVWIVVANSWMQTPAGYHLETVVNGKTSVLPPDYVVTAADLTRVRAVVDDFWAMVFNPSTLDRLTHVVLGAWLAGAFLIVSISAYYVLRNRHLDFAKASLKIGLGFAAVACVLQMVSADFTAKGVARNQPIKLAAMEGVYATAPRTPMTLFGYVDAKNETVTGPKIPGLLSLLAWGSMDKPVVGLRDLPDGKFLLAHHPGATPREFPALRKSYWPNAPLVFQFYHLMIIAGVAMLAVVAAACFFWWRGWLFDTGRPATRWLLTALIFSVLGPQIANQAGWFAAEMGRQPWIVYGLLKTSESLSKVVTANQIVTSLVLFALVYALLFAMFIFLLTRKIQHGPDEQEEEMPDSWKALIRTNPRA
ncbi:MAG: cytochrome ubiquinol oxidase subunit I [Verrucomicrobiae bacterium]